NAGPGPLATQIIERKNSGRHFERSYRRGSPPYQSADREQQASHYGKSTPSTPAIEDHHSSPQGPNERSRGITHPGITLTGVDLGVNGIREQTYIAMSSAGCKKSAYSLRCFSGYCLAGARYVQLQCQARLRREVRMQDMMHNSTSAALTLEGYEHGTMVIPRETTRGEPEINSAAV